MHLNKLSTAALMRLSLLASLNLLLGRFVGYWLMLHPLFFLILTTLDLGLYALLVYSGTLNRSLIAMMGAGLAGVLAVVAQFGIGASAFAYGGPFRGVAEAIEALVNQAVPLFPGSGFRAPPKRFWWANGTEVAHLVIDAIGLGAIVVAGMLSRALQARSRRRDTRLSPAPLDAGAASPL